MDSARLRRLVTTDRRPAVVLFAGEWCGDCAAFAPRWRQWTSGKVEPIYVIEVGRGAPEWSEWKLDEIPTVAAYSDGIEKGRAAGTIHESDLDALLAKVVRAKDPDDQSL